MAKKKVYPIAFEPKAGLEHECYYIAFPAEWKEKLIDIRNRTETDNYHGFNLRTDPLKELLINWLPGVVKMDPLGPTRYYSSGLPDQKWLTCLDKPSDENFRELAELVKLWIQMVFKIEENEKTARLGLNGLDIMQIKSEISDLVDEISADRLKAGLKREQVKLIDEDGRATGAGFDVLPYLIVAELKGKEIAVGDQVLHLCYQQGRVGNGREMITTPFHHAKSGHQYSYVFRFSLETIPPKKKPLVICHLSMRRWIPACKRPKPGPYLNNVAINAKIKIDEDRFCEVPILRASKKKGDLWQYFWDETARLAYEMIAIKTLPDANDVIRNPEKHKESILLPFKNGMENNGFVKSAIGTGVSFADKVPITKALRLLLSDYIEETVLAAETVIGSQMKPSLVAEPDKYESRESFRSWVHQCSGASHITFELYGHLKEPAQRKILDAAKQLIEEDFGENHAESALTINVDLIESGTLTREIPGKMEDDKDAKTVVGLEEKLAHRSTLKGMIPKVENSPGHITACICVIPDKQTYEQELGVRNSDPKGVLRSAFGARDRVVQFVHPLENNEAELKSGDKIRVRNGLFDLYRQIGVMTLKSPKDKKGKNDRMYEVPCLAVYRINAVEREHGNKLKSVPLFIEYDFLSGKTAVYCELFKKKTCSYREACLQMSQLYFDLDKTVQLQSDPVRWILEEKKNKYWGANNGYLVLVESNKEMTGIWQGISDKALENYKYRGPYRPTEIDVSGRDKNDFNHHYMESFENTGIRIMRIRGNDQVPDYYTDPREKDEEEENAKKESYQEVSGIFKFHDVFWMIGRRWKCDYRFINSAAKHRNEMPTQDFAESDMLELYPVLLQEGDSVEEWLSLTNGLRYAAIQYNDEKHSKSTRMPLPLHLASCLEEYLFKEK